MQNTVTVKNLQSCLDIGIQTSGSQEAVFEFAIANDLSITDNLDIGSTLNTVKVVSAEILQYYVTNSILPATDFTTSTIMPMQGIGYWGIAIDFIVS